MFDIAYKVSSDQTAVYRTCESVIQDFANDNVFYLELRTTPRTGEGMTKEDYIEAVVKAVKDNKTDTIVKILLSINRVHDPKVSHEALEIMIKMFKKYPDIIMGVELSGNPIQGTFDKSLFTKAREAGMKVCLHCAEVKSDQESLEILEFRPDRIGHGTFLHPDHDGTDELWQLLCTYRIPTGTYLFSTWYLVNG